MKNAVIPGGGSVPCDYDLPYDLQSLTTIYFYMLDAVVMHMDKHISSE